MELTQRQEEILELIREHSPISGEEIAKRLGLSRSALRTDFSILKKLSLISSKRNHGYCYRENTRKTLVKEVMTASKGLSSKKSVYETIIHMFEKDAGTVFITDENTALVGVVSRKDLLKTSLGNKNLEKIPIYMVMTRMPNVIHVEENVSIEEAVKKLMKHQVDSIAVVRYEEGLCRFVGRFTKTNIAKLYLETL